MKVIENNLNLPEEAIFNLSILKKNELIVDAWETIGNLTVYKHPNDKYGGQVHIEISPKWRCKWVSRGLRDELINKLSKIAKTYNLKVLYSTAFTEVSPRLLAFAKFVEYSKSTPKTYYYLKI